MANVDNPRGFIPLRLRGGGPLICNPYVLSATNGEIAGNDLLERRNDGFVALAQATSITLIGTAAEHVAANTGGNILVYDDPDTIFLAQMDEAECDAQTDMDLNYNIVVTALNARDESQQEIDSSTQAATATLPIKVLRRALISGSELSAFGANVAVECMINNHLLKSTGVIG